jgi:hypothetical protein
MAYSVINVDCIYHKIQKKNLDKLNLSKHKKGCEKVLPSLYIYIDADLNVTLP